MPRTKHQVSLKSKHQVSLKSPLNKSTPIGKHKKATASTSKSPNRSANKSPNRSANRSANNSAKSSSQRRRRLKPGKLALQEIRYYQRTTMNLIPRLPFCRLIKEIITNTCGSRCDFRIQTQAVAALQEATEAFMVRFLEEANLCAIHAKRVTLQPKDLEILKRLKYPGY